MKKLLVALLVPIMLAGCGDPVDLQPTPTPAQPTPTMTATPTAEQAALQSTATPPTTPASPTSETATATQLDPTATTTQPPSESSPTPSPLPEHSSPTTVGEGGTPASPSENQDEDQPTATATPLPEPASTQTASPTPTATPSPAPTATPTPTPPPTASPTSPQPPVVPPSPTPVPEGISEDEYVHWAYDIFIRWTDVLIAYSEHLTRPGFDRTHPDNAAWYATFVALLGDWESLAAEAAAQPAPSSLAAQHQEIVAGYGKIGEGARLHKLAYDTSDGDVLAQAGELVNSGISQISTAMDQLPPPSG